MPDVSIFNLGGQSINVKDATARTAASAAQSAASAAQEAATAAESRIEEIADLARIEVSYNQSNETITITTTDHQG